MIFEFFTTGYLATSCFSMCSTRLNRSSAVEYPLDEKRPRSGGDPNGRTRTRGIAEGSRRALPVPAFTPRSREPSPALACSHVTPIGDETHAAPFRNLAPSVFDY